MLAEGVAWWHRLGVPHMHAGAHTRIRARMHARAHTRTRTQPTTHKNNRR
jgi:hypothetical protein